MDETGTVYRSVMLTIVDSSKYQMDLQEVGLVNTAAWAPRQAPVPYQEIPSNGHVVWIAQTTTPRTGVSGYVMFAMPQGGILQLNWDLPWVEPFTYNLKWLQQFDPQLTTRVVAACGDPGHINLQLTLFVEYVVQQYDTFDHIAHQFNIPVQRLYAAVNGPLEPGMHIVIPPPDTDRSSSVGIQITTSFTAVDNSNKPVTINELYLLPDCLKNVNYPTPPYTDLQLSIVPVAGLNAKAGDAATEIALGDGNQVFSLQWKTSSNNPLVAQVTVANMPVFAADSTVHSQLKTAFTQFKIALETLENQQCLIPGGAQILAQRVIANLPLRFEEVLWFYYGYDSNARMVDLSTMMRLQVQYGNYQYIAPNGFSGSGLNSFAGSGQVAYDITVDPKTRALMFNTFMRAFSPPFSIINQPSPNEIANVVDLAAAGALHRHYRLIYPNQFYNVQAIYDDPSVTYNVTLLSADTLAALETATQQFLPNRDRAGISGASFVFFSGRTSVFPLIPVFLQYNSQGPSQINLVYLPLGTTVNDLFSQTFGATAYDIQASQMNTPSLQLYRYMQPALCAMGSLLPPFGRSQIGFPSASNSYFVSPTTGMNYLDIPLVAGDKIIFTI